MALNSLDVVANVSLSLLHVRLWISCSSLCLRFLSSKGELNLILRDA